MSRSKSKSYLSLGFGAGTILAALAAAAAGCSGAPEAADEEVGAAEMALTQAPPDARCIRITVVGASRTVTRLFDVAPGQTTVLALGGLPVGSDTFAGDAFPTACSAVGAGAIPTWVSDPITAAVAAGGGPVSVPLVFRPNGRGSVSADFQTDPTGGAAGALPNTTACTASGCQCVAGFADCDGSFVNGCETNLQADTASCGVCGQACEPGASCLSGACTVIAPLAFSTCVAPGCGTRLFDPFSIPFSATGGVAPYTWSTALSSTPVPPNDVFLRNGPPAHDAALFSATGLLAGPPPFCINCTFLFQVCVSDSFGRVTCHQTQFFSSL